MLRVMRKRFEVQLALGKTPIEKVGMPARSRDELPPVLAGLQWVFQNAELNSQLFELLEKKVRLGIQPLIAPKLAVRIVLTS